MFRPGIGEILFIGFLLALLFVRSRADQAQLQAKALRCMQYLAPASRGGAGGWATLVAGFVGGVALCAGVAYLVWRHFFAGTG